MDTPWKLTPMPLFNIGQEQWTILKAVDSSNTTKNLRKKCKSTKIISIDRELKGIKDPVEERNHEDDNTDDNPTELENNAQEEIKEGKEEELWNNDSEAESDDLLVKSENTQGETTKDRKSIFPIFKETFEKKNGSEVRVCLKCLKSKPDRWHHCSICNSCILLMDHHCPWLNNWVGINNYKYFFNTIFYNMISSIVFCATYWEVWGKLIDDPDTNIFILYMWSVAYFLGFIFMIVLVSFTGLHIRFLITNYTTLEYCEKRRGSASTWQVSPYYSTNWWYNIAMKLGFNYWMFWLIPIEGTKHRDGGFHFKVYKKETSDE